MAGTAGTKGRQDAEDDITKLTTQFLLTLRAYFARVPKPPTNKELYDKVEALLLDPSRTPSWNDCYEAEQLLVDLFDDETLRAELDTRKLEASNLRPALADHYAKAIDAADKPARQRVLLARLINDLQWRYTINQGKREFAKLLTRNTGYVSAFVLLLYALLIGAIRWSCWSLQYEDLSLFFVAAFSGAWGATFSMMTSMQRRIDSSEIYDLNVMRAFVMITSRVLVGVTAASILYFFLASGLLGGTAFPTLSRENKSGSAIAASGTGQPNTSAASGTLHPTAYPALNAEHPTASPATDGEQPTGSPATGTESPLPSGAGTKEPPAAAATGTNQAPVCLQDPTACLPIRDLALLIVWCILAGFSEQLVPGLLAKTESRADSSPPERFRPNDTSQLQQPRAGDKVGEKVAADAAKDGGADAGAGKTNGG